MRQSRSLNSTMRNNSAQSFKQVIRTFMLRMLGMSQQSSKFALMHPPDQLQQVFSRLLHGQDIKQSTINELTNVQIKSDQHCLLILTLLCDFGKWAYDTIINALSQSQRIYLSNNIYNNNNTLSPLEQCAVQIFTIQSIINQSLNILKQEKKHQTLISKQNQLIRILLQVIPIYIPVAIAKNLKNKQNIQLSSKQQGSPLLMSAQSNYNTAINQYFQYYQTLYNMLKQVKQSYQSVSKQQIKRNYNKGIQDSIKSISYIFTYINRIFSHISQIQNTRNPLVQCLVQMIKQNIKLIQLIHNYASQDIYKIIYIFNTLNINNQLTISNSHIILVCMNIFPQVYTLYTCNFSQILLSRLKIIKLVIQCLETANKMNIVTIFTSSYNNNNNISSNITQQINRLKYNQYILHKTSHILIQINYYNKMNNYYIFGIIYSIYEIIIKLLLNKDTMVPLYLYTHLIINNIKKIMDINCNKFNIKVTNNTNNNNNNNNNSNNSNNSNNNSNNNLIVIPQLHIHLPMGVSSSSSLAQYSHLVLLESLLSQIANIFQSKQLYYFLRLYDWNFMEEDICLNSIKYLYQFIQNSDNQHRPEYQLFKKCLAVINKRIQQFLQSNQTQSQLKAKTQDKKPSDHHIQYNCKQSHPQKHTHEKNIIKQQTKQQQNYAHQYNYKSPSKQRKQFYELKKKQYTNLVEKMNKKPKQLFKIIQQFTKNSQTQMKQDYIQKCVRIIKKSKDIQNRSMIDFLAANSPQSEQILQKYLQSFIRNTKSNTNQSGYTNCTTSNLEHFLRYIISNFFLSGESQQIVRFIDKTTSQFFKHQTPSNTIFKNSDSVYTFANAIIILNTDQHNPKNQNKMNLQSFMKMCEKINNGQNLDPQMIKIIYRSIKQSQIHTYRNRYNMQKISLQCWLDIVNDYDSVGLEYYDNDMADIVTNVPQSQAHFKNENSSNNGFREYANQLLLSVIDEKQTQKLQIMVQRFQYDDRKFDCEIIQKIRGMIVNKKHIAMHILQKIYEEANFTVQTKKIDDKMISYCWLAAGIIDNFNDAIPFSKIAQFLLKTWRIGFQLKDNLYIRQNLEFKSVRKMLKDAKKRQSKKSIINIFSKFLSSQGGQNQENELQSETPALNKSMSGSSSSSGVRKRANVSNSSFEVLKLLLSSNQSRARAAETVLFSIRIQQARRYEQFIACLYLMFHLIYGEPKDRKNLLTAKQVQKLPFVDQSNRDKNIVSYQCIQILANMLYDFFQVGQSCKIGARITALKSKNIQKYEFIYSYVQYWALKTIIEWTIISYQLIDGENDEQKRNATCDKINIIYNKCESLINKLNVDLLTQLVSKLDLEGMTYQFMIQQLKIPKQIIIGLKSAIQFHSLKLKFIPNSQIKLDQTKITKSKSEPNLASANKSQNESFEQIQKYMKQLNISNVQPQIKKDQITKSHNQINVQSKSENNATIQYNIQQKMKEELGLSEKKNDEVKQPNIDPNVAKFQQKIKQQSKLIAQSLKKPQNINVIGQKHAGLDLQEDLRNQQIVQNEEKKAQKQQINLQQKKDDRKQQTDLQEVPIQKQGQNNEQLQFPVFML